MNAMEALSAPADLADAIRELLSASPEPLTLAKIRERLPAPYNDRKLQEVADVLQRQVAANVIVPCPEISRFAGSLLGPAFARNTRR